MVQAVLSAAIAARANTGNGTTRATMEASGTWLHGGPSHHMKSTGGSQPGGTSHIVDM